MILSIPPIPDSDHLAVENALQEHGLRGLGPHVRVGGLLGDEDSTDLAQLGIDLVDLHLNGTLTDVEHLVGLLEELLLARLAISLQARKSNGLVIAEVHATHLGVEEATGTVRRHLEFATPGETRLELCTLA